jgi:Mur ligase middle domain
MIDTSYQAALDDIYATFMRVKHLNKGRFDREARQPQRLLAVARTLGIMPPPEHTIKISGSKGKGTTARITAQILQNARPTSKIGLFVSPEEDDHHDRMRINGVAMSRRQFVHHYARLKPQLLRVEAELSGPDYLSPLGLFLLIALVWFHAEGVEYYVLETGRGVANDEVGQIRSKVGLLTSIMMEHADKLGPTLAHIARDKLSLCDTADIVYAPPKLITAAPQTSNLKSVTARAIDQHERPQWLSVNNDLALAGVGHLLGCTTPLAPITDWQDVSASFGIRPIRDHTFAFEGLIHTDSLDQTMLDHWQHGHLNTAVIASLPDDKDREQLLAAFAALGWPITECILTGTRGYLDYVRTQGDVKATRVTFAFDDVTGFATWLAALPASRAPGRTYLVGTQTYIRLVRKALALMAQSGGPHGST